MPYVPPHRRVGAESGAAAEAPGGAHAPGKPRSPAGHRSSRTYIAIKNARTVALRLLLDDGGRAEGEQPQPQRTFEFVPYLARSYAHLGDGPLYRLRAAAPAQGTESALATGSHGHSSGNGSDAVSQDLAALALGSGVNGGAHAPDGVARDGAEVSADGRTNSAPEAVSQSADSPHATGTDAASQPGTVVDRQTSGSATNSSPAGGSGGAHAEPGLGPTSPGAGPAASMSLLDEICAPLAKALEDVHCSLTAQAARSSTFTRHTVDQVKMVVRLGKVIFSKAHGTSDAEVERQPPFTRSQLEKHMSRQGQALQVNMLRHLETSVEEDVFSAMESLAEEAALLRSMQKKYNITVDDKDQQNVSYKLICTLQDSRLTLHKVKSVPVRHAVVDVIRPGRMVDFRIILSTETLFSTLPREAEEALQQIVRSAVLEPAANGGLHWRLGEACAGGRFAVRGVRECETLRMRSHGFHWKLRRVSGRDMSLAAAGRLTNEVEFAPKAWKEQLRTANTPKLLEQSPQVVTAPQWTPASIVSEVPGVLSWLDKYAT